jgi:hypothetical protein
MTAVPTKPPTYLLRLRAVDPDHDDQNIRRLRALLKLLLRKYRFRVLALEREDSP